jgi:hypothetical protein
MRTWTRACGEVVGDGLSEMVGDGLSVEQDETTDVARARLTTA